MIILYRTTLRNGDMIVIFTDDNTSHFYKKTFSYKEHSGKNVTTLLEKIVKDNITSLQEVDDMEQTSIINYLSLSNSEHVHIAKKIRRLNNLDKLIE